MFLSNLTQYSHTGFIIFRLVLGIIFVYHGAPKMAKSKMLSQGMGFPAPSIFILGLAEALAGLSVIFNFYIQIGALIIAIVMLGALYMKILKWKVPFFAQDKTGWEFDLILFASAIALLLGMGR